MLVQASNDGDVQMRIDAMRGEVELLDLQASTDAGEWVSFSLRGALLNTQPRPQIIVTPGPAWNEVTLTASTFDAEFDPIVHRFMVLGQESWIADTLQLSLPPGRHGVVLFAEDPHGARGVTATWVEIGGIP